jgi:GNAT superfamily N-acetyltransferase
VEIVFRRARPDEAGVLSDLALRSKAHWGYEQDFLDRVRDELTFTPGQVANRHVVVAEAGPAGVVGFYSIDGSPPDGELGNLWLDPPMIGTGLGRRLWEHATMEARAAGFTSLRIDADPGAEGFYLAMGAQRVGEVPSGSIPDRVLPSLRQDLC